MREKDPTHWLFRMTADEWLRAGMRELSIARDAFAKHSARAALASARRAAGMGWNAVLALDEAPDPAFGRSYAEHLQALADGTPLVSGDSTAIPDEVRVAAKRLMDDPAAGPSAVVALQTKKREERLVDAAETVLAEAWSRVQRRMARERGAR